MSPILGQQRLLKTGLNFLVAHREVSLLQSKCECDNQLLSNIYFFQLIDMEIILELATRSDKNEQNRSQANTKLFRKYDIALRSR